MHETQKKRDRSTRCKDNLRRSTGALVAALVCAAVVISCIAGCGEKSPAPESGGITARELVGPDALVGPGPSILGWSPQGALLAYTAPPDGGDGADALWLYDASSSEKMVLLDPSTQPDNIDVTSAQWSPRSDAMLLTGDTSLWALSLASGELRQLVEAGSSVTAMMFMPTGTHVSYVQDNDIYSVRLSDGQVQRITSDGSDAVMSGCLDWVYNEEMATRAAQPGYAWSPDGKWLMYMRLDDSQVQNDPVTDYDPVPPTVSYTRYPTAGSPNPAVSMHALAPQESLQARDIPLPPDSEYVLPFYAWTPDSGEAMYITVNRDHTLLRLNAWDPASGAGRVVIEETDPKWINEDYYAAPVFLEGGERFL